MTPSRDNYVDSRRVRPRILHPSCLEQFGWRWVEQFGVAIGGKSVELKYAFIQGHEKVWPISVQCRVLEASVAGYHEHFVRRASAAQRRHLSDDALLVHIKAIHAESRGGYGWPRVWKELLARGIRVGNPEAQQPPSEPQSLADEQCTEALKALAGAQLGLQQMRTTSGRPDISVQNERHQ